MGTGEGGLQRLDGDGKVLERFINDPRDASSLSDDYVTVLLEDRRGRIWVGTRSGGLNELDPATGHARRLAPKAEDPASLGHHHVTSLLEDSDGRLWVGTAAGEAQSLSPLDDRVRTTLEQAYVALNHGRPFAFPTTVSSIDEAKVFGHGQVDRSLVALKAGRSEEAARELMGFVLLVVTPMERHQ